MSLSEIESEIRKLELHERAALVRWLLQSLDDLSESELETLWVDEAERRLDEVVEGKVTELPAEDVLERARTAIS